MSQSGAWLLSLLLSLVVRAAVWQARHDRPSTYRMDSPRPRRPGARPHSRCKTRGIKHGGVLHDMLRRGLASECGRCWIGQWEGCSTRRGTAWPGMIQDGLLLPAILVALYPLEIT